MAIADIYCDCMKLLFFELIQVAIGRRERLSHTPTEMEWRELYAMAEKQAVIGICFCGVQRFQRLGYDIPMDLYMKWLGMAAKIQQRNEVVNAQCVEVQQMMEKAGFRTYIMKGQGNAALYKSGLNGIEGKESKESSLPLLRQSGDIDIYLDGGFDKVMKFVNETHPTKEVNELEIHYHCLADTEVEIHYRPFIMRNPFKNRKLQRFFEKEGVKCFENKIALPNGAGEIAVPTTTFNLVHQLVHIAHHLYTDGIGFRQLMDYYFVLRNAQTNGFKEFQEVLDVVLSLGLDRFASALMWVIGNVFDPGWLDTWILKSETGLWKTNEKDGRLLLEEVIKSGNFGHMDETKADLSNKWKSFWHVNGKTFRFWRFDHWAWFWSPLWRVYHFAWRKTKGFE